jgi:hypothetical protein
MRTYRSAVLGLVLVVGTSACAGTPTAESGTQAPSQQATTTPTSSSGPSPYSEWVALQGFGGGSGIAGLARAPRFLREHTDNPGFDLTSWAEVADGLVRWLVGHEPTTCWAGYHAAVAERLKVVAADFAALRSLADAGKTLTVHLIDQLEEDVTAVNAIATPVGCD